MISSIAWWVCKDECDRQKVGPDRVARLRRVFEIATNMARFPRVTGGITLTLPLLLELAEAIEPDNKGELRRMPVSFKDGATAIPHDNVPAAIESWIDWFNEIIADKDVRVHNATASFAAKEFLDIHPVMDGNARLAFVFHTWVLDGWDNPKHLPYFYGDE